MITNYLDILPEELYTMIYKHYFSMYIICEINNIISANKWIKPSKRLCLLCQDHGCLQLGNNVDNTLNVFFDTNKDYVDPNNYNCGNCLNIGWPCYNCAYFEIKNIGVTCMWDIGKNNKKKIDFNLRLYIKSQLKWNQRFSLL